MRAVVGRATRVMESCRWGEAYLKMGNEMEKEPIMWARVDTDLQPRTSLKRDFEFEICFYASIKRY